MLYKDLGILKDNGDSSLLRTSFHENVASMRCH